MLQFAYHYRNILQTRELIEKSYNYFIKKNRKLKLRSSDFSGKVFFKGDTTTYDRTLPGHKNGKFLPDGYPVIF
jgi:hypothetical protein